MAFEEGKCQEVSQCLGTAAALGLCYLEIDNLMSPSWRDVNDVIGFLPEQQHAVPSKLLSLSLLVQLKHCDTNLFQACEVEGAGAVSAHRVQHYA